MMADDQMPSYSKSLSVNPIAQALRPIFYGGNGRFVMSWTIVFILLSSSLVISLTTSSPESFCTNGNVKGIEFLIAFWGVCSFIAVIIVVFSNFARIMPARDHEDTDYDEEELSQGASVPLLLNTSDISIVDSVQAQMPRPSVQYSGALSNYKIPEHKNGRISNAQADISSTGKKPRRFTTSNGAGESVDVRNASSSGPHISILHHSASHESLRLGRTGGILSNEILMSSSNNQHRPSILRSTGFKPPTKQANQMSTVHHHSIIELAGLKPDPKREPEFEWTREAKQTHLILPLMNIISWLPWIIALSQYEGGEILAYAGIVFAVFRQIALSFFIQVPSGYDEMVAWVNSRKRKSDEGTEDPKIYSEDWRKSSYTGSPEARDAALPPEINVVGGSIGDFDAMRSRLSAVPGSSNELLASKIDSTGRHSAPSPENNDTPAIHRTRSLNQNPNQTAPITSPVDVLKSEVSEALPHRRRISVTFDTGGKPTFAK
jgi:hypothetical protein